jgi:hypothetical protein
VYVAFDKGLAFRLAVLTLVTMSVNHFAKMLIANPRPFIADGSYVERWAVSPERAGDLATEFSTPSGHAMAGAAFYTYLFGSVQDRRLRVLAIVMILLTGLSRPYLGVHYLEDVLLGWVVGAAIALLALRFAGAIRATWSGWTFGRQVAVVTLASLVLWLFTRTLVDASHAGEPTAFVSYAGFLTGIVIGAPLERRYVDFDPRSSPIATRALRYALTVALADGTLTLLDVAFATVASDASAAGDLLRYLRYALAGVAAIFAGPWLFLKLGWASACPRVAIPD